MQPVNILSLRIRFERLENSGKGGAQLAVLFFQLLYPLGHVGGDASGLRPKLAYGFHRQRFEAAEGEPL